MRTVHQAMMLLPKVVMIELSDGGAETSCLHVADIPGTFEGRVVEAKPLGLRGPAGGGKAKADVRTTSDDSRGRSRSR